MSEINVVIVGAGKAGIELHLNAYRKIPGVKVQALCDVDLNKAASIAARNDIPGWYSSLEEALVNHEVDVVSICSPPGFHYAHTRIALEKGCGVVLEKPIFESLEEAERIGELLEQTNGKFSAVHNQKFRPGYMKAMDMYLKGEVGFINQIQIVWMFKGASNQMISDPNHWCHQLLGGRWQEMIAHPIYKAYAFVGPLTLKNIEMKTSSNDWPWLPADELDIVLESETGFVNIKLSANVGTYNFMLLFGSKKLVHVGITNVFNIQNRGSIFSFLTYEYLIHGMKKNLSKVPRLKSLAYPDAHRVLLQEFVRYYKGEIEEPPVSWEEAYNTLQLVLEVGRAIDELWVK